MKIVATKPMDRIIGAALDELTAVMAEARSTLIGPNFSLYELKYEEAKRYLTDKEGKFPLLSLEATEAGVSMEELASTIVSKRESVMLSLAELEVERQQFQKAFRACGCPADVQMILKRIGK